jgi:Tol biopolymer transport system component
MCHLFTLVLASLLVTGCDYEFSCHELRRCPYDAGRWDAAAVDEPDSPSSEADVAIPVYDAGLDGEGGARELEGGASFDAPSDSPPLEGGLVLRDMVRVGHAGGRNSACRGPSISGDGSVVAFASRFGGAADEPFFRVWLWARGAAPRRLDQRQAGPPASDGDSTTPHLSRDGTVAIFRSAAAGIVLPDTNGTTDAFLVDTIAGTTSRVTQSAQGAAGNGTVFDVAMSPDGQSAAFSSSATNLVPADTNGQPDVFVYTRSDRTVTSFTAAIPADGPSGGARVGSVGTFVFRSAARNLVAGAPDTDDFEDVFVSRAGLFAKVSAGFSGGPANGHSREPALGGDFVAFTSDADNLIEGDSNGAPDVFVHDLRTTKTERVSLSDSGDEANGDSDSPSISEDGRFVAFRSSAGNLVSGDEAGVGDVFVRDRLLSRTLRVSRALDGTEADGWSGGPVLSADGAFVAFESQATNLAGAGQAPDGPLTPGIVRVFRARVR